MLEITLACPSFSCYCRPNATVSSSIGRCSAAREGYGSSAWAVELTTANKRSAVTRRPSPTADSHSPCPPAHSRRPSPTADSHCPCPPAPAYSQRPCPLPGRPPLGAGRPRPARRRGAVPKRPDAGRPERRPGASASRRRLPSGCPGAHPARPPGSQRPRARGPASARAPAQPPHDGLALYRRRPRPLSRGSVARRSCAPQPPPRGPPSDSTGAPPAHPVLGTRLGLSVRHTPTGPSDAPHPPRPGLFGRPRYGPGGGPLPFAPLAPWLPDRRDVQPSLIRTRAHPCRRVPRGGPGGAS